MEIDTQTMNYIAEAAKYISLGLICLGLVTVAKGVASIFTTVITCISRNPNVKKDVTGLAWGGAAITEAIALYALAVAIFIWFL